ncbi:MAG: hypothetical protein JSV37_02195, partial [Anaerolineaceae bacterium]
TPFGPRATARRGETAGVPPAESAECSSRRLAARTANCTTFFVRFHFLPHIQYAICNKNEKTISDDIHIRYSREGV